jgi:hypothetical protein
MRISTVIPLSRVLVLVTALICAVQAQTPPKRAIKNVTGHYRLTKDEFRNRLDVLQLASGKIKFYLLALWVSYNNPENIHNGELQGIVMPENRVAIYVQDDCKLKFEFFPNRVRVTQLDDAGCGFGANVTAAGSYRKWIVKNPNSIFSTGTSRGLFGGMAAQLYPCDRNFVANLRTHEECSMRDF